MANIKWNKGDGAFRARLHPLKLPTSEKKLKKRLEPSVVVHAYKLRPCRKPLKTESWQKM